MKLLIPLFLLSITVAGCHTHDDQTVVSATSPTYWYLSYEEVYETEEIDFFWDTTLPQAEVEIRLTDFHHGSIRVRIYDDAGFEIFDEFFYDGDHHHDYDDDLLLINTTEPATPGTWRIRTSALDFTGHLYVTIY